MKRMSVKIVKCVLHEQTLCMFSDAPQTRASLMLDAFDIARHRRSRVFYVHEYNCDITLLFRENDPWERNIIDKDIDGIAEVKYNVIYYHQLCKTDIYGCRCSEQR